jgi:lipid-binding SYLF domain-containing protein
VDVQVRAFDGAVHIGLGGNISVAAGPLGRHADATLMVSRHGAL